MSMPLSWILVAIFGYITMEIWRSLHEANPNLSGAMRDRLDRVQCFLELGGLEIRAGQMISRLAAAATTASVIGAATGGGISGVLVFFSTTLVVGLTYVIVLRMQRGAQMDRQAREVIDQINFKIMSQMVPPVSALDAVAKGAPAPIRIALQRAVKEISAAQNPDEGVRAMTRSSSRELRIFSTNLNIKRHEGR